MTFEPYTLTIEIQDEEMDRRIAAAISNQLDHTEPPLTWGNFVKSITFAMVGLASLWWAYWIITLAYGLILYVLS